MTTFDKREDAFENKFIHDKEAEATLELRKVKRLAQWAAEKMQYDSVKTAHYAEKLMDVLLDTKKTANVIHQIVADIQASGHEITEALVHAQFISYEKQVRKELGL